MTTPPNHEDNTQKNPSTDDHQKHLLQLAQQLETLNQHKLVRVYNSTPRLLWLQFWRGVAFGLGSLMGATLVVSLLISLLAQIEFIPIIGEWAQLLIAEIKSTTTTH